MNNNNDNLQPSVENNFSSITTNTCNLIQTNGCNSTNNQVRCAIYTRKSTENGLEMEYNSLANQYDTCKNYILSQKAKNWVLIAKQYNDGGYSGGTIERPALKELMNDVENGLIDVIVVYKIDRFSRSIKDFINITTTFDRCKINFVSVTQNFETNTSMGKLILNLLLSFAQFEREIDSERTKDKIRSQQKRGMYTGGTPTLGYDVINKKLIINTKESKIVETIFNTFIETSSINEVLNVLKQNNYKTKTWTSKRTDTLRTGKSFNRGHLYKILTNKLYTGSIENKVLNETYKGQQEAIITFEQFNKVQEIFNTHSCIKPKAIYASNINQNNNNTNQNNNNNTAIYNSNSTPPREFNSKVPYLLKGLLKCECCNSIMTATYSIKTRKDKSTEINENNKEINENNKEINENNKEINEDNQINVVKQDNNVVKQDNNVVKQNNNNLKTIYRYYTASKEMKHSNEHKCKLGNIPAEQIEKLILQELYKLLKSPEVIANTINNLKLQFNNIANNTTNANRLNNNTTNNITEQDIIKAFSNIELIFNELFPREQVEILHTLIKEIIINETGVKIIFKLSGFINLINETNYELINNNNENNLNNNKQINMNNNLNNLHNNENNLNNNKLYQIVIPINFCKNGNKTIVINKNKLLNVLNTTEDNTTISFSSSTKTTLIKALLKAKEWLTIFNNNKALTLKTFSKQNNFNQTSYLSFILSLNYLAPTIQKAILNETIPETFNLQTLRRQPIPLLWEEQMKLYGFVDS